MRRGAWNRRAVLALCATLLAACGGSGQGLDENGRPIGEAGDGSGSGNQPFAPTIEAIQQHVFSPICAECHRGALAPQGLHLSDTQTSYNELVNKPSREVPTLDRVTPDDPNDSYIIHKLEGTQESGNRMPNGCPQSRPCLDQDTINVIRKWISNGALPPGSSAPGAAQ